jgi:hypothetical protein
MRSDRLAVLVVLAAGASALCDLSTANAQQADPETPDGGSQASSDTWNPKETGNDLTRPQNSLDLRFRNRESSGETSETSRNYWIARITRKVQIDPDWKLSVLAQTALEDKRTWTEGTPDSPDSEEAFGFGNSVFQAALVRSLNERMAFGFGARLVAPTASDDIGNGKWQIMPAFGVRYTFTELSPDTYFVPKMRYAMSFAGDPTKRNISEPQISPTFNLDLAGPWFLTFYPSYDIRINYGEPVSGQTGRLFLPADVALGYALNDKTALSLEVSVPIIKDYPVYDFKTEFRVVIKN